jgi:hypothetical protein
VVKSNLSMAFKTSKIQSPASTFNNCVCAIEQPCLSWRGIRHGSTAASGSTARGSEAAAPGAPEFEYEQGMQVNPTEGFQGGDDAGTETAHAHSSRI